MEKKCKKNSILIFATLALLTAFISIYIYQQMHQNNNRAGILEIVSSDENYYYDEVHGIRFPGYNMNYTTYYFLPSYIQSDDIIQASDSVKVYLENGDLLKKAKFGEIQNVNVDFGDGNLNPWKMCFMKSENINSVFIDLDTPSGINDLDRESYNSASINIYDPNGLTDYSDSEILIKGRGNSTWHDWAKKPLEIKLQHKSSLCDLQPSNKWVLLANYYDGTFMANKIAFDLSRSIGLNYSTDSYWVDVFSNNEYMGIYLLCKEPKIDEGNVDISNIEKSNDLFFDMAKHYESEPLCGYEYQTPPAIVNTGYLIKKESAEPYEKKACRFVSSGLSFAIQSPNNASIEQVEYIKDYIEEVNAQINNKGSSSLPIDEDSFIKRFLIEEFMFNQDAFGRSYYFYKTPESESLYAGPCWDYDNAVGFQEEVSDVFLDYDNSLLDDNVSTERFPLECILPWDFLLYRNNEQYRTRMQEIFSDERTYFEDMIFNKIPEYEKTIYASAIMDNLIWPETQKKYGSFNDNIRYLRFFLYHRLIHMSEMLQDNEPLPVFSVNTSESHTVTFIDPGKEDIVINCPDGAQLSSEDIPEYDEEKYYWKKSSRDSIFYSFFCPIYEDTVYELREL